MKFISISGKAGSGKDTIKGMLMDYYRQQGKTVTTFSFAGPLKDALCLWFGWDRNRLNSDFPYKEGNLLDDGSIDPYCAALGLTRRQIMQQFGTECMRDGLHRNFWIIMADLGLKLGRLPEYNNVDIAFVPDARLMNELQWIKSIDGFSIHVIRATVPWGPQESGTLTTQTSHASEVEFTTWDSYDSTVHNVIDPVAERSVNMDRFEKTIRAIIPAIDAKLGLI